MTLTPSQQRAIKAWVAEGYSQKGAALRLRRSLGVVDFHLRDARARLGLKTLYHLAVWAGTMMLVVACARMPGVDQHEPRPMLRNAEQAMIPPLPVAAPRRTVSAPQSQSQVPFTFSTAWLLSDVDVTAYAWTVQTSSNLTDWVDYPTGSSVTLAWDAEADPSVAGYRIYSGTNSRIYTSVVDAGNTNVVTVLGLLTGVTHYFAATVYNTNALESGYSAEITFCLCGHPSSFAITSDMATNATSVFRLKGTPR